MTCLPLEVKQWAQRPPSWRKMAKCPKNLHTSTPKTQSQPLTAPQVIIIRDFFSEFIFWDKRKVDTDSESLISFVKLPQQWFTSKKSLEVLLKWIWEKVIQKCPWKWSFWGYFGGWSNFNFSPWRRPLSSMFHFEGLIDYGQGYPKLFWHLSKLQAFRHRSSAK